MMGLQTKDIRNVAILGHQGSGKTTLVEAFYSLTTGKEKGSVEKGTTVSDFLKEEKNKLSSVSTSLIPITYKGCKLNILDVPGNDDFVWEAISAVNTVEGAVLVVDASSGVQVNTMKDFRMLKKRKIPTIIFVNKMDKGNPNSDEILEELKEHFGKSVLQFAIPLGHGEKFDGFIDVIDKNAQILSGNKMVEASIREDRLPKVEELHNIICEKVAVSDDTMLEKYFSGEPFTLEEMKVALKKAILADEVVPVIYGCALNNVAVEGLLDIITSYTPSLDEIKEVNAYDLSGNEVIKKLGSDEPFAAKVIKTTVDPYLGTINLVKIESGKLKVGDEVLVANLNTTVKISSMYSVCGKENTPVNEAIAGDYVAINKLDNVETKFTLCDKNNPIKFKEVNFPTAVYFRAISLADKKDEEKLNPALQKIMKEDPTIELQRNVETKQLLIGGLSASHLQFIFQKLKDTYGVKLVDEDPKIVYRETIKGKAEADGRYIKQSGGSGFYGVVKMRFEPNKENEFAEEIFGGAVPKNYFPAVEKGFYEACQQGLLAGFPVIGMKATLVDGKYHPVDSNELAFKMAAILSFKEAYMKCKPTILEPILRVSVYVANEYMGDTLSDLTSRRARVQEVIDKGDENSEIVALVPESEMGDYVTKLKALTQGSGYFVRKFECYEEVPEQNKAKVIETCSLLKK